jgi:dTMP kinase
MKRLISFEGIDGSGKSYQLRLLRQWYDSLNKSHTTVGDLSSTEIGRLLSLLIVNRHDAFDLDEADLMMLFTVARRCAVREVMSLLNEDSTILCDRYLPSTYAYLAHDLGNEELFFSIAKYVKWPDLSIWIDTSIDTCMRRIEKREVLDRFDRDASRESLERKRKGYEHISQIEGTNLVRINGDQKSDLIHEDIKSLLIKMQFI